MSTMERILRLMAEKKASDIYLSAHAPAMIKINGQCLPINNQLLPPDAPKALLAEVLPARRMTELEETGELNMAHAIEGVGNFRFSAMRQRGTYAAVIRYITTDIPALETLQRAHDPGRADHGKARPAADGGRHRRRQEHHAGLDDGLPQRERRPATSSPSRTRSNSSSRTRSRWSTSARSAATRSRCRPR